ncbi:MAG: Wzz/FepE/Etk N-terminal domain-containing protein [Clostridium sp.]|nr:Wzz/FepE/Etk N-terminal domain-containing protein [Clostridium sp.]MCM1399613.1 Wzz/FepE/Etk N-terminal domain-containing protein [Clostridium sp.]MCM1460167.1 Wzz/FepE/Etk N-terminal domain-containing protein [Bacteroides sp.]
MSVEKMEHQDKLGTDSRLEQVKSRADSEEEKEIDLLEIGSILLDKLHFIIMYMLLGAVLLNACSYFLIEPTYQSTAKLYVVSASDDSVVNLSDLNIGTSLTADYEQLILSYPVLDKVIARLNLDMTSTELAEKISLVNPDSTRILNITATTTDPELSMNIANTVAEVSVEYLPEAMSTQAPNIAQVAKLATHKAGPSCMRYTVIGAILAAVIYCGIVIVQLFLDDTIHTAEDMEKHFGIVPLTSIPESEEFRQSDGQEEEKTGRHRRKGA